MRGYLMRAGHIEKVEELPGLSDRQADRKSSGNIRSEQTSMSEGRLNEHND
jgi:hypothetical protein